MPVYLALQLISCAARNVTISPGELLPRLFTLTDRTIEISPAVIFCHIQLCPRKQLPVRKYDTLCCPDFPPAAMRGKRQAAILPYVQRYQLKSILSYFCHKILNHLM